MITDPLPRLPAAEAAAADAELLAAVDLGSNSFRLELARLDAGRYRHIATVKDPVRLGSGLDGAGWLTGAAMRRGLDCLEAFGRELRGFGASRVRAVATQTLREALNREEFLRLGAAALGHPIELISGREEARLIYAGVVGLAPPHGRPRLVIDIGGRSTEIVLGEGRVARRAESFPVGSASITLRFFADERYTRAAFLAAQAAAGAVFEEGRGAFAPAQWDEALGASGTVTAVSRLLAAHGVTGGAITREGLHWCIERCLEAGSVQDLRLHGLKADRRPMLGGGLAILMALLTCLDIEALRPAEGALRQGLIFELGERRAPSAGGLAAGERRDAALQQLAQCFPADAALAQRGGGGVAAFHAAPGTEAPPLGRSQAAA